jgi:atlastin
MGDPNEPLSGFSWKHGYAADTKGILFWPDVFLHDDESGEKVAIILMDTQGLFEIGSTFQENARIFSLSTLISSIQIVNISGVMQENLIEYLEMATNLTKFISQKKISGDKIVWKPFQKLLFLIRDWADEEAGFKYEGGQKYLNDFLNTEMNSNTKAQIIRTNINQSFDKIECFLLNHPGLDVQKKNFKGEWSKLNQDFIENLKILIESILSHDNLTKKSILGKAVTSIEFRDFIYSYFKAFRSMKLPEDENILQMMIDNQMKVIVSDQIKFYQHLMNEKIEFDHENFENYFQVKHNTAKEESVTGFLTTDKLEDETNIEKYKKILQDEIENCFTLLKVSTMREYQRFQQSKEIIEKLQSDIDRKMHESILKQKEYEEKIKNQEQNTEELNNKIAELTQSEKDKQTKLQEFKEQLKNNEKIMKEQLVNYKDIWRNVKGELRNAEKPFKAVGEWFESTVSLVKNLT